jgi:hypothetical protein
MKCNMNMATTELLSCFTQLLHSTGYDRENYLFFVSFDVIFLVVT